MAVYTVSQEAISPVAANRLFKALVLERHFVQPKAQPHVFKSCEIIQGDGGVGSVTKTTFAEGLPMKYMLHRIDELEANNYYCKYTLFEGDVLRDYLECIVYEVKMEPAGEGCKGKITTHYHPKLGCTVNEEKIKAGKEKSHVFYKQVEEYLIANPDVYYA